MLLLRLAGTLCSTARYPTCGSTQTFTTQRCGIVLPAAAILFAVLLLATIAAARMLLELVAVSEHKHKTVLPFDAMK